MLEKTCFSKISWIRGSYEDKCGKNVVHFGNFAVNPPFSMKSSLCLHCTIQACYNWLSELSFMAIIYVQYILCESLVHMNAISLFCWFRITNRWCLTIGKINLKSMLTWWNAKSMSNMFNFFYWTFHRIKVFWVLPLINCILDLIHQ